MWWNNSYLFRRPIVVQTKTRVEPGEPVTVQVPKKYKTQKKIRTDLLDVEIVYEYASLDDVQHYVLERAVSEDDDWIYVTFDLFHPYDSEAILRDLDGYDGDASTDSAKEEKIASLPVSYYVYYGNETMEDSPRRHILFPDEDVFPSDEIFPNYYIVYGVYTEKEWPSSVTEASQRISYTRPGDDWKDGVAHRPGATATFKFHGERVRILSDLSPEYGAMEVQLNEQPWVGVDLKAGELIESQEVFSDVTSNPSSTNTVRVRVAGTEPINVKSFEYKEYTEGTLKNEEVNDSIAWSAFTGGV